MKLFSKSNLFKSEYLRYYRRANRAGASVLRSRETVRRNRQGKEEELPLVKIKHKKIAKLRIFKDLVLVLLILALTQHIQNLLLLKIPG
jgi:hypothetical protein